MRLILPALASLLLAVGPQSTAEESLKPGQFEWKPDVSPAGPILLVCSLDDQMLYAFRNGVQFARSTGSFGSPESPAPTGVFAITPHEEHPAHDAARPLTRQLSWTGLSIPAAGPAPRPAPFNSLHLPPRFSDKLLPELRDGATLVITRKNSTPSNSSAPAAVLLESSTPEQSNRALPKGRPIWEPEKSPSGPLTIFLSYTDRTVYVWRNGVQIGQCPVTINVPADTLPEILFLMLDGPGTPAPDDPEITVHPWTVLSMTGGEATHDIGAYMRENFTLHPEFRTAVNKILKPGTLLFASKHSSTGKNQSGTLDLGSIDDLPDPE